jgi:hypothetical protein
MLAADLAQALDPVAMMRAAGLEPDPWQADLLRSNAGRVLMLCSRQSGKSTTAAIMGLHEALYHPPALVLLLSPSLRQSQELFKAVTDLYLALGRPVDTDQATALRLGLANGSRIVSLPGQEKTIRGFSGVRLLVIDEAARVSDDLYYSVRPMLAVSGGRLVALSTPWGKRGFFHQEWTEGAGDWLRVKVTADQCPRIPAAFLEQERAALGDWWYRQEYGCEFVETTDQVFSYDEIMGAISAEVRPLFGG